MTVQVLEKAESYRLITDGEGHYAVIEARNGHVYSLESCHRHSADDTMEGMEQVVSQCDGWRDEETAWRRFLSMARSEERYSQIIW